MSGFRRERAREGLGQRVAIDARQRPHLDGPNGRTGHTATEQPLKGDGGKGELIGCSVRRTASSHFRRRVGTPDGPFGSRTEPGDLGALGGNENILGMKAAVNLAGGVSRVQSVGDRPKARQ